MKLILAIVAAGVVVYLLLKCFLYLYRPFFLSRTFREIEEMYNNLLTVAQNDVRSAVENFEAWQSGDEVAVTMLGSKEHGIENIKAANAEKAHEEEVHGKFLRLRERFIQDPRKLSESIAAYQRYLRVRLKQCQNANIYAAALSSGVMTFEEVVVETKETTIVVEETERKLDILLS